MSLIQPPRLESYAHAVAKRLLLEWLREAASNPDPRGIADFAGFTWAVNRGGPAFGIWDEYPILSDGYGASPVWDEIDDRWRNDPPSYDDIVQMGFRPMAVVDIAIQRKGRLSIAIEVHHKHRVDARKLNFLRALDVGVLEVPSAWALGQVDRPREIPGEFWLI